MDIQKFNINTIEKGCNICVIGKRATGKTKLVHDILYNIQGFSYGIAFDPCGGSYPMIPNHFKWKEYHTDALRSFNDYSKKYIKNEGFAIFNQCFMEDPNKYNNVRWTVMNGRCVRNTNIFVEQYSNFRLAIRTNMDYIFLFREHNVNNIQKLYEHYGCMISSFEKFRLIFEAVTKNYGCMVIDNRYDGGVYWYKAELHPDFKKYNFPKFTMPKPCKNLEELKKKIGENCPICLEEMANINNMLITKCLHAFHQSCYSGYKDKHKCPYCRSVTGL